jgi:spermidine synthase
MSAFAQEGDAGLPAGHAGRTSSGLGAILAHPAVMAMFLASGATGLVLEVTWTRMLGTVFGNTIHAASTVLTVYMLGLALGSAVLGRVADRVRRPLLLYGCLEIGVGLYAMVLPWLLAGCSGLYVWLYRAAWSSPGAVTAGRFALSVLMLLPPTFLMGGTLPVLGRHLAAGRPQPGRLVGYLYAVNTFGAVGGCILAGFVLLEALGVRGSLLAAGVVAVGVGCLAAALGGWTSAGLPASAAVQAGATSRGQGKTRAKAGQIPSLLASSHPQAHEDGSFPLLLAAFALTGFCALACEVLYTRVLVFVLSTSVYAFAGMLAAFLIGLAAGSLLSARWLVPRISRGMLWFGLIELLVAAAVLGSVFVLAELNAVDLAVSRMLAQTSAHSVPLLRLVDAMVVLLIPTTLMGAAFPIVTHCCLGSGRVGQARRAGGSGSTAAVAPAATTIGRRVGLLYAANTVGCVLGSFAGAFLLLPALGTLRGLLAVVALNFAVGAALVCRAVGRAPRAWAAVVLPVAAVVAAAFAFVPPDLLHRTINTFHHPSTLAFLCEHSTGTVTVHDLPNGERLISVDGVNVAGLDFMLRTTQKLQGYIPLLLHPNPRRVVQIGFGSGETARVGLEFGVPDYTVVEICPAVLEAGKCFEQTNHGSWRDGRIRRIIADGKNFARLSDEKFDLVMNDSTYPGSGGSSALYTVDHFRNCRDHLAEGGLLSCWVPLDLRPSELRMILRSFQEVFPHTTFWVASNCLNKHGLILGGLQPLRIDLKHVKEAFGRPGVAADLAEIAIHDAYDLLDCLVCDEDAVRKIAAGAPVNSDDRPLLEFSCACPVGEEGALQFVLSMLTEPRGPVARYVVNMPDPARDAAELARRFEATNYVFRGLIAQLQGLPEIRARQFALAVTANPGEAHVLSCQQELARETRDLRAALADRPKSTVLACRLAEKIYASGHYDEAGELYQQLAGPGPGAGQCPSPVVLERLANIRFHLGQVDEAEKVLRRCMTAWPRHAPAYDLLAGLYVQTRKLDLARHNIRQALRLDPDNPYYRSHRAYIESLTDPGPSNRTAILDPETP